MKRATGTVAAFAAAALTTALAPGAGAAQASLHEAGSGTIRPSVTYVPSELTGVAAVSRSDVWAVGVGAHDRELVEHFDGDRWRLVQTPRPGAIGALTGVSASAADDVWAVGEFLRRDGEMHPLVEHYDGTSWSVVQAAPRGTLAGLTSVSAESPDDVWAVGNHTVGQEHSPVALHWDGTQWTPVTGMDADFNLVGVAAVSPRLAWLVGTERKPADLPTFPRNSSAIYRWDGSTLTRVSSPSPARHTYLLGVAAASAKAAWAVGYTDSEAHLQVPRVFSWTGHRWKTTKTAKPLYTILTGASATPNGDAWAVGYSVGENNAPIVEAWNGNAWSWTYPQDPFDGLELFGVAATSPRDVWVVGQSTTGGQASTLIEHYDGSAWSIVR